MTPVPGTLVLDDGELEDVRGLLDELGVAYTYLRGSAIEGVAVELPDDLLIATARRALELDRSRNRPRADEDGPVRVVMVDEDSTTLRSMLRSGGYDYLVRRPVHPSALRLLLLKALYRGPERRGASRIPIGFPITYKQGFRRRSATLLEVALRGCRLECDRQLEPDERVTVVLPKTLTASRALPLAGWVLRCQPGRKDGLGERFDVAVAFQSLSSSSERRLREVLSRKTAGPETLDREEGAAGAQLDPPATGAAGAQLDPPATADGAERRVAPRGAYERKVVALQDEARRALVGRNLSVGGMLLEQNLDLSMGDEVKLAIFGREREEPVLVLGQVVRDDAHGVALRFLDVDEPTAARLESLVAGLPSVERLADSEAEALGTVMAEIVRD